MPDDLLSRYTVLVGPGSCPKGVIDVHFSPLNADTMCGDTDGTSESRSSSIRPGKTQYRLIEYVEDLDRYRPGGYHPLKIGDDLDVGRYPG